MANCNLYPQSCGIQPIRYADGVLSLLDQRRLPVEEIWLDYTDYREVAEAIRSMVVRGAPAIGVTAAYGALLGAKASSATDFETFWDELNQICDLLGATRPTAVNLFWALERVKSLVRANPEQPVTNLKIALEYEAMAIAEQDVRINMAMGRHGAQLLPQTVRVLTHCNAGALATAGYGTALGVVRAAVAAGKQVSVLADETRPFLQGARLTAWELQRDGIPVTLICDNMAGALMAQGEIDAVIVGADRIAANGDTANKIGTYTVAVLAHEHNIPFYVAAPTSTVDLSLTDGSQIPIEQRDPREVTHTGDIQLAPQGIEVRNPAFDVTPARLITAIITEQGVARGNYLDDLADFVGRAS
ncbi:MAG: S-methyl-5-thioribose-1-phosphate isomerase [Desulfuromonas sp.]|nr:MAG: S-methyl-5-thioribose-1-phosphate isomerase [Desulfuromonas sp.]